MFYLVWGSNGQNDYIHVSNGLVVTGLCIGIAVILALYLLRSIGLFVLAKRSGIEKAWVSFIPAVWIYIACKLAGDSLFFGKPFKKMAFMLCIVFSSVTALSVIYNILIYFPLVAYIFQSGQNAVVYYTGTLSNISSIKGAVQYKYNSSFYLTNFKSAYSDGVDGLIRVLGVLLSLGDIVTIIITVFVYFALFRKYWPRHYILISVLSLFLPLFGLFVFIMRKKEPIDFSEYIRNAYRVRMGNGASHTENSEPFENFTEKKDEDPFAEFSNDKDKNDKQ